MAEDDGAAGAEAFRYPRYDELPEGLMFVGGMVGYANRVHAALPPRAASPSP